MNKKFVYQITIKDGRHYIEPTYITKDENNVWIYDNPIFETIDDALNWLGKK